MKRAHRESAFEAIIQANEHDLLRYFQRRLLTNADAADAFGDLMLTAWKLRRRLPADPTEARMWLFATAHNVLRGARRTAARRSAAADRFAREVRTLSAPTWDESAIDVRDALERIPAEDAEIIRLTYWDGLSSDEVAGVLRLNPSTVRTRLSRARQRLRVMLEPRGPASDAHDDRRSSAFARTSPTD